MKLLTAREVSRILRERPETTIRKLNKGEIPAYREGRFWRIPDSLLTAYVENKALTEAQARRDVCKECNNEDERS
jgi:excisionase family DNA binding protein